MKKLKAIYSILRQTIKEFTDDRLMKMSASLTYYTLFSLSPILLIVLSLASMFYKKEAIENRLYLEIKELVGSDLAIQIQNFVKNSTVSGDSNLMLLIGVGVLIFGATKVFTDLQDSLNLIWRVKAVPKQAILKFLFNRGISFLFIMILGILLFSTVILSGLLNRFGEEAFVYFELDKTISSSSVLILNNLLSYLLAVFIFFLLFKFLPDITISYKPVLIGAIVTAFFFFIAKYFINYYLSISRYNAIFGSAGSVVILLMYIYYNAAILYFGAKFTKVYAEHFGYKYSLNRLIKEKKLIIFDN